MTSPAERLLQELGVTEPAEIELEAIAWHVGADVHYQPLEACEARIIGASNRAIITVDSKRPLARRRFSTAHELGHWKLHRGKSFVCRADDIGRLDDKAAAVERAADAYAADLVLPRYLFQPMSQDFNNISFEAIEQLAAAFKTSLTATTIRTALLGPQPAMVVCHGSRGRKWFKATSSVPSKWFPAAELSPDSSSLAVQFGRITRSRQARVSARAWFDHYEAERFSVTEQTTKVGDDTLSLIVFHENQMLMD